MNSIRLAYAILSIVLVAVGQPALAATASTQFSLGGYLNPGSPGSFNLQDLQAFAVNNPSAQKSVSVANSSGGTDTYAGVSLYGLLGLSFLNTAAGERGGLMTYEATHEHEI